MKCLLFVLGFLTQTVTFAQTTDSLYRIYDVKQQKEISVGELIDRNEKANVFFFGEDHNDSVCHVVEFLLAKKLSEKYHGKFAISMEMFHTDLQPVINEYLASLISERNFVKESNAWPNYADYKPIVEYAKQHKIPILAANVAARYSNAVTTNGLNSLKQFPKTSRIFLPPIPIDTAIGRYYEKFNETLGGHGVGGMQIYQTQNLWDASMAWTIASYLKEHSRIKILQLNGRFHSDEQLGAVAKLRTYSRNAKIVTISSFSGKDFAHPKWKSYENLAEYIVLTNPDTPRTY
ncbi:putative iron-regulated protein [Pedobacter sp. UYEF25]